MLPCLMTLLCWTRGYSGYLTQDPFRNNKRIKLGYLTCGSNSSHLYKVLVKAPITNIQRTSSTCIAVFVISLPRDFAIVAATCISLQLSTMCVFCLGIITLLTSREALIICLPSLWCGWLFSQMSGSCSQHL